MRPGETAGAGPVAVCTLTDTDLAARLRGADGVGLAGPLLTANLGIEEIVWAVLDRPWLRFLLVCGRDSPLFEPGQSLTALVRGGVDQADRRIVGARGYRPFLYGVTVAEVAAFRRQVELVDLRGEADPDRLRAHIAALARRARPAAGPRLDGAAPSQGLLPPGAGIGRQRRGFVPLKPGGRREPVAGSGDGFFVIALDRVARHIVVEHYRPDLRPAHRMRGSRAESMLLGLVGAGIVSGAGHAGYLGMELAKAETALRLGLDYEQDKPLRRSRDMDVAVMVGDN